LLNVNKEITMSKRQEIIEYITANPTAKAAAVAYLFGTSAQVVYQIKSDAGLSKPRTNKTAKPKAAKKAAPRKARAKQVTVEIEEVDEVNHPPHYLVGGIEVIDYIKAKLTPEEFRGYLKGNVIKYISRADHKNGMIDWGKADWYVDRYRKEVEHSRV
jgi:hypothetical protein